jgi:hypothetical protein
MDESYWPNDITLHDIDQASNQVSLALPPTWMLASDLNYRSSALNRMLIPLFLQCKNRGMNIPVPDFTGAGA